MEKHEQNVEVISNPAFLCIITLSAAKIMYTDPDVEPIFLPPDVDNETLGYYMRLGLSKSRIVSSEEMMQVSRSGAEEKKQKEIQKQAMRAYGYKTRQALNRNNILCYVCVYNGKIEISPSDHEFIDWYQGKDESEDIHLLDSAANAELGAAIREGFSLCTNSYKEKLDAKTAMKCTS